MEAVVAAASATSARSRSRTRRDRSASDGYGRDECDTTLHEARAVLFRLACFYESAAVQAEVEEAVAAAGRGSARHLETTRRVYRRARHHVLPAFGLERDAAPAVFEAILRRHAHDPICLQRLHDINRLLQLTKT